MIQVISIGLITLILNNIKLNSKLTKDNYPMEGFNKNLFKILNGYNKTKENTGIIGMIGSIISLYIILWQILKYNNNNIEIQERIEYLGFQIGIDGIGLLMIGLIGIIEPIILILVQGENNSNKERTKIINIIIIIKIIITMIFSSMDLLLFFITFEIILLPMFLLITKYGSKYNNYMPRLEAGIRFFMYTMMGSILMLITIIIFYILFGSTNNEIINIKINEILSLPNNSEGSTNSDYLTILKFAWIFFFFSFLIKIPMFPFHTWLPLAHSDAPTIGSIVLAAILLKLASFGIIRYSLFLFEPLNKTDVAIYDVFLPIIYILGILSILYSSLIPLRGLIDLKKIIAYTSIIHMNFSIFGFFSKDLIGLTGSTLLMFTHAFISSALFLLVGILYKRYHTRYLNYYQGLIHVMPLFSFFFLFFTFANISLPFCSSFLSEFFILFSSFHFNPFITLILLFSLILSSSFSIWINNRLLFGSVSSFLSTIGFKDLSFNEFFTLFPFFFFTFFFTFFPNILLDSFILPLSLVL